MKRTERHHLKEDEIRTGLHWFVEFYESWKREILISAGVLVFAAAVFGALLLIRSQAEAARSRRVGEIVNLAADLDQKPENVAKLDKLVSDPRAGRLAALELAGFWLGKGDIAKSQSLLDRIPDSPKDLEYYQAQDLKGQALVKAKDYDKAIAIYKKIQEEKPKSYPLDAALFHLAEAYELKGATKEALELYQKLATEYSQTYYGYEASLKAGRLGVQK
jgi:tetratricopeptide (TPR) repeat protein